MLNLWGRKESDTAEQLTHGNPIKPWLSVNLFREGWHLCPKLVMSQGQRFYLFKKYYLFIWLHPVFVVAYGSFLKLRYMGSSSLTRDRTQASYIRRMECKPRDHHGSPRTTVYFTSQFDGGPRSLWIGCCPKSLPTSMCSVEAPAPVSGL